jgi:hypothetical protein
MTAFIQKFYSLLLALLAATSRLAFSFWAMKRPTALPNPLDAPATKTHLSLKFNFAMFYYNFKIPKYTGRFSNNLILM